jgi:hypothetical protein
MRTPEERKRLIELMDKQEQEGNEEWEKIQASMTPEEFERWKKGAEILAERMQSGGA